MESSGSTSSYPRYFQIHELPVPFFAPSTLFILSARSHLYRSLFLQLLLLLRVVAIPCFLLLFISAGPRSTGHPSFYSFHLFLPLSHTHARLNASAEWARESEKTRVYTRVFLDPSRGEKESRREGEGKSPPPAESAHCKRVIYSPLEVDDFRYFSSAVSSKQLPFRASELPPPSTERRFSPPLASAAKIPRKPILPLYFQRPMFSLGLLAVTNAEMQKKKVNALAC